MPKGQGEIQSERDRLESDSAEQCEELEAGVENLEKVSDLFDTINREGGTAEGMDNVMDNVTQAQNTGSDKVETVNDELDETTQEVDENQEELENTADDVNENIETIKDVEGNIEDSDLQSEVDNAEQAAVEDFEFLDEMQQQLVEISELSKQIAAELGDRAEAAKSKGV